MVGRMASVRGGATPVTGSLTEGRLRSVTRWQAQSPTAKQAIADQTIASRSPCVVVGRMRQSSLFTDGNPLLCSKPGHAWKNPGFQIPRPDSGQIDL